MNTYIYIYMYIYWASWSFTSPSPHCPSPNPCSTKREDPALRRGSAVRCAAYLACNSSAAAIRKAEKSHALRGVHRGRRGPSDADRRRISERQARAPSVCRASATGARRRGAREPSGLWPGPSGPRSSRRLDRATSRDTNQRLRKEHPCGEEHTWQGKLSRAPDRGAESGFCCWIAWRGLQECSFRSRRHGGMLPRRTAYPHSENIRN